LGSITTAELPKYEVGRAATELLLERIAGKTSKPVTCKIMSQLFVRESFGFQLRTRTLAGGNAVAAPAEVQS